MDNSILNRGYGALEKEFSAPGHEFRGKPFWSWNGELEERELKRQVDVLKEMGFGGYFMHSRAGLITEYLGEEWFDLCNKVAVYGEENGMEPWLYDEDRWPSGCAGGIVTRDPKYRMKSLVVKESAPDDRTEPENLLYTFEAILGQDTGNLLRYRMIKSNERALYVAQEGQRHVLLKFFVEYDKPSSGYNGTTYIDTMMLAATEEFIRITHEAYKKHAGRKIWETIRGIFTDEPHRGHMLDNATRDENGFLKCSVFYTDDIFDEFEKRYGYAITEKLPEFFYKAPDFPTSRAVKHDYVDLGNNLFIERFAEPINRWCVENGIDFTGHVLHEDSLANQTVPNGSLMRFYEHMGVPGIDNLTEFANVFWAAKQIQSAARQLDKKWILSELYGCSGWQFNFKGHKAVGDWQALYGVNVRCPHLSWYTMEGEAKRDYPASILHQATYYKYYKYVEDYFARFNVLMTEGVPACDVLVMNPIESVWTDVYAGWARWIQSVDPDVNAQEDHYRKLFAYMRAAHVDFDYGEEEIMAKHGCVEKREDGPVLKVGSMEYKTVVVSGLKTVRGTTLALLKEFSEAGGRIVLLGDAPYMVDARDSNAFDGIGCVRDEFTPEAVVRSVKPAASVSLTAENIERDELHFQVRDAREKDGIVILAVVNADRERGAENVKLTLNGFEGVTGCVEWCLEDGKKYNVRGLEINGGAVSVTTDFTPAGERFFVFYFGGELPETAEESGISRRVKREVIFSKELAGEFDYELGEKNAMVLDFADANMITTDGTVKHFPEQEVLKLDRAVRDFVGIEHRGGGMLQPWYAKKYADSDYGQIALNYTFEIENLPEGDVLLCAERPEKITYFVNGERLVPDGGFWTDNCLKTIPVSRDLLKVGENVVTALTHFRRTTNIEAAYIVGDFGVRSELIEKGPGRRPGDRGSFYSRHKKMTVLPDKLTPADLAEQNLLSYTGTVTYKITPEMLAGVDLRAGEKAVLRCADFAGSLVTVEGPDGSGKQILGWEPYEADVTEWLKTGFNVTLVCTRKNLFGPLHVVPAVTGAVGPDTFVTGGGSFTEDYALADNAPGRFFIETVV